MECVYSLKLCAYLLFYSEAGQGNRQVILTDFLFDELTLRNSVQGIACRQAHGALRGVQLCKGHESISSKNLNVLYIFSILVASNATV